MQQMFIPFSPFKPKTKSDNMHEINNITISQWQKKAKPKRGNCTGGGAGCPILRVRCDIGVPKDRSSSLE
jgi:hypothetical protein